MTPPRTALLLIGSPKPGKSTSETLGQYLLERLTAAGLATRTVNINKELKTDPSGATIAAAVNASDVIVLAAPLYIDSIPAGVIRAMNAIATTRKNAAGLRRPLFAAIVNSGFPESHQNDVALMIYRRFAHEAGLTWAGGLALGGGGAIGPGPLAARGGMVRNVMAALDGAANALGRGDRIPESASALMAKPLMPAGAYLWVGQIGWIIQALKKGTLFSINARPYER